MQPQSRQKVNPGKEGKRSQRMKEGGGRKEKEKEKLKSLVYLYYDDYNEKL